MIFCAFEFQVNICGIERMNGCWYVKLGEHNGFWDFRVHASARGIWDFLRN